MRFARITTALVLAAASGLPLVLVSTAQAPAADRFRACVERFWRPAKAKGVSRKTFDRAFQGVTHDPEVIEAATYQPEYVKPIVRTFLANPKRWSV